MAKVIIANIGKIVSGNLKKGILNGDTIMIENGLIVGIGWQRDFSTKGVEKVVDANGLVVTPGLIDSHTHPFLDDWSPITKTIGWMESALFGGTTTIISATTFTSGLSLDPAFVKILAILAERSYRNSRPGGHLKLHAGTIILVKGLTESDFKEMADAGVHLVSEIGCAGITDPEEISEMLGWARKYDILVSAHYGGRTITGSSSIPNEDMLKINPDVVAHVNGGSTARSLEETSRLVAETDCALEVIFNGNVKMMYEVVKMLKARGELHRLIIGSDMPVGTGLCPLVVHRMISQISSLNEIPAQDVIACATGNTADLVKANTGKIEVGREADLVIMDNTPGSVGSDALGAIEAGDTVGTNMVMVDGHIVALRGRDTKPTTRNIKINGVEQKMEEMSLDEWVLGARHPGY